MNIQRRAKLETTITLDADEWFDFQTGKAGVYFVVKQVCLLSNGDVRMHGQITGGNPVTRTIYLDETIARLPDNIARAREEHLAQAKLMQDLQDVIP